MNTTQKLIRNKIGLLNLAEELGNISKACSVMGLSRQTFYRYQELVAEGGLDNLIDRSRKKPNIKNRVDEITEKAVVEMAIEFPAFGQHRASICERFHKTILQEFYQIAFRKKLYSTLEELQKDLDEWVHEYNNDRTHQGKMCCGRTPMTTFFDGLKVWREKNIA